MKVLMVGFTAGNTSELEDVTDWRLQVLKSDRSDCIVLVVLSAALFGFGEVESRAVVAEVGGPFLPPCCGK
jgi:hypothetical protein